MPNSILRRFTVGALSLLVAALMAGCASKRPVDRSTNLVPPEAPREFRAAWVATVGNIDWPSRAGLSTQEQQQEILAILDEAKRLNLNAIVLQVRTSCDAFYPSSLEPWSQYLTGTQGEPPEPFYDPLKMWVDEAHRRGIELHAWFNPYRARAGGARGPSAPSHISQTNPAIVKSFNGWEWLDPGEEAAQDLTYNVFLDVVKRYDVDGVHIDDYFYPYPDYLRDKETGKAADFPDAPSWGRYVASGGKLARADWRRQSVDRLIQRIYTGIKRTKPHVQFGISPFGIWQPGHPPTVKTGFNQHESLYADAKRWLNEGWCDYYTPQLYWKVNSEQPFRDLLEWWSNENTKGRHLWPGLFTSRVGDRSPKAFATRDIVDQISVIRETPTATGPGHVHFSMKALMRDYRRARATQPTTQPASTNPATNPVRSREEMGIAETLATGPYAEPALAPASPWLDKKLPASPRFELEQDGDAVNVRWTQRGNEQPRVYAVYAKHDAAWKLHVVPPEPQELRLEPDPVLGRVTAVAVRAVDRSGNQSKAVKAKKLPQTPVLQRLASTRPAIAGS